MSVRARLQLHFLCKFCKLRVTCCASPAMHQKRSGISAWFGNLTVPLTQRVLKIIGVGRCPTLQNAFEETIRQAQKITPDPTHVLHPEHQLLPSGTHFSPSAQAQLLKKLICPPVCQSPK